MGPHSIFLPGESPWTEEPGGLQSMELQTVRYDRATKQSIAQQSSTTRYNFISCTLPPLCCSDLAPTSLSIQFRTENVYKPYSAIFHFMCSVLPLFIICQILYTPGWSWTCHLTHYGMSPFIPCRCSYSPVFDFYFTQIQANTDRAEGRKTS